MTTAYYSDARTMAHNLPDHPENAGRQQAINALFAETGLLDDLDCITPEPATEEQLLAVHTTTHLKLLEDVEKEKQPVLIGGDTYVLPESYSAARLSAGAAIQAVSRVLGGEADNALVAARPPGHHALVGRPMGFCLLGNVALAARHAQRAHDVARILIVDYDVHHGNGTQDAFYDDPGVLFISTHQSPFYPGTGAIGETGTGAGTGTTLNIPLQAGYGDDGYRRIYDEIVWPAAARYQPELILVSAGFDAHWDDPLGSMTLTLGGYDHLTRELIHLSEALCGGRIVFILEGGYNLKAVSYGLANVGRALAGKAMLDDPMPLPAKYTRWQERLPVLDPLIAQIREVHNLST